MPLFIKNVVTIGLLLITIFLVIAWVFIKNVPEGFNYVITSLIGYWLRDRLPY